MDPIVALETAEAAAFEDFYAAASPEVAAAVGLSVTSIGDATLLAVNRIDVLALNHSSYTAGTTLLQDIELLLRSGIRPPDRRMATAQRVATPTGVYWRFPSR